MTKPFKNLKSEAIVLLEKSRRVASESRRVGSDWLFTDAAVSLDFATEAAKMHNSPEKRERNRINARRGYEAVTRFMTKVEMSASRRSKLEIRLRAVKSLLLKSGERFPE